MARPKCCRRVRQEPACRLFQPSGGPIPVLEEVVLSMDEFEAIRLADLEGLYHEQAAGNMNVSRQTFGRIIGTARRKVAKALSEGHILRIEGGDVEMRDERAFTCDQCRQVWSQPERSGRPRQCPRCSSTSMCRSGTEHETRR